MVCYPNPGWCRTLYPYLGRLTRLLGEKISWPKHLGKIPLPDPCGGEEVFRFSGILPKTVDGTQPKTKLKSFLGKIPAPKSLWKEGRGVRYSGHVIDPTFGGSQVLDTNIEAANKDGAVDRSQFFTHIRTRCVEEPGLTLHKCSPFHIYSPIVLLWIIYCCS